MWARRIGLAVILILVSSLSLRATEPLEWIKVSDDQTGFICQPSGKAFTPWGFNYDHDETGRLLEDYWEDEWPKVEADFQEMKALGANVVRVHLQVGRFLRGPDDPNPQSLRRLRDLLTLAERTGLHLDLTGLGCYHKADVPAWYEELDEQSRWNAQATFWKAIAQAGKHSPAIFCYDLMNEPVVPGGKRAPKDWLGPAFAGKHFVQVITLDQRDRPRPEIAKRWIRHLVQAIRQHDQRHLVTVGLVDWSLDRPGLTSGFVPKEVTADLDFLCVHLYPQSGHLKKDLETLKGFQVGKPVVIEETFPLKATPEEFREFLIASRPYAQGFIGFYWGKAPEELRTSKEFADQLLLKWLEIFEELSPIR